MAVLSRRNRFASIIQKFMDRAFHGNVVTLMPITFTSMSTPIIAPELVEDRTIKDFCNYLPLTWG